MSASCFFPVSEKTSRVLSSVSAAPDAAAAPLEVVVAAESLFLPPARHSRPKRIAVILRGLPGSGKSAAARKLRELELAHGGEAPRVLSLDDYFVTVLDPVTMTGSRSCKILQVGRHVQEQVAHADILSG